MAILTFEELLNRCNEENINISQLALKEEALFMEVSETIVRQKTLETLNAMKDAIMTFEEEVERKRKEHQWIKTYN